MARTRRVLLPLAALVAALLPGWAVTIGSTASAAATSNGMIAVSVEQTPDQEALHQRINVVSATGGSRTWLTENASYGDAQEWWPRWSPDGNTVVFFRGYGGNFQLALVGADGSNPHTIGSAAQGAYDPAWSPDGQWIYYLVRTNSGFDLVRLWRMRPDGSGAELVPLPPDVHLRGAYAIAPDGRLVYGGIREVDGPDAYGIFTYDLTQGTTGQPTTLVSGSQLPQVGDVVWTDRIDVSPSGQVLFDYSDPSTVTDSTCNGSSDSYRPRNLYVVPQTGGPFTQITHTDTLAGPDETLAAWSPDGTQIVTATQSTSCTASGDVNTWALRILSSQGSFVRDLPLATFQGASWQPCTAATVRCAPAAVVSPTPSPSGSGSSSPTPSASASPSASSSSATEGSTPSSSAEPGSCPDLLVVVNTPTINATGLASVSVLQATPGAQVELQGYSQNHYATASFDNDPTPVDRVATADENGAATFDDLRPASNTRLRARLAGCPDATDGSSAVITVRTQLTLAATRVRTRTFSFSGNSIPARPGGLVVGLYRVAGSAETLVSQARADATSGRYSMTVTFPLRDQGQRLTLLLKTGRDAQNAAGRSNSRLLLIE